MENPNEYFRIIDIVLEFIFTDPIVDFDDEIIYVGPEEVRMYLTYLFSRHIMQRFYNDSLRQNDDE